MKHHTSESVLECRSQINSIRITKYANSIYLLMKFSEPEAELKIDLSHSATIIHSVEAAFLTFGK